MNIDMLPLFAYKMSIMSFIICLYFSPDLIYFDTIDIIYFADLMLEHTLVLRFLEAQLWCRFR